MFPSKCIWLCSLVLYKDRYFLQKVGRCSSKWKVEINRGWKRTWSTLSIEAPVKPHFRKTFHPNRFHAFFVMSQKMPCNPWGSLHNILWRITKFIWKIITSNNCWLWTSKSFPGWNKWTTFLSKHLLVQIQQ